MSTATVFGSRLQPVAQPAPAAPASVAPMSAPLSRNSASLAPSTREPAARGGLTRLAQAFDRWTASRARSRADARLWDVARSDPRIMGELMHARMRDGG